MQDWLLSPATDCNAVPSDRNPFSFSNAPHDLELCLDSRLRLTALSLRPSVGSTSTIKRPAAPTTSRRARSIPLGARCLGELFAEPTGARVIESFSSHFVRSLRGPDPLCLPVPAAGACLLASPGDRRPETICESDQMLKPSALGSDKKSKNVGRLRPDRECTRICAVPNSGVARVVRVGRSPDLIVVAPSTAPSPYGTIADGTLGVVMLKRDIWRRTADPLLENFCVTISPNTMRAVVCRHAGCGYCFGRHRLDLLGVTISKSSSSNLRSYNYSLSSKCASFRSSPTVRRTPSR